MMSHDKFRISRYLIHEIHYIIELESHIMRKRVTIMIDEDLDKKLRLRQAKIIQQNQSSCSYSRVLNETLRKSLK